MARKTALAVRPITSRSTLSVSELHAVSRDAALLAADREASALTEALESIESAEALIEPIFGTAASVVARHEVLATVVALKGAAAHLRAGIKALAPSSAP